MSTRQITTHKLIQSIIWDKQRRMVRTGPFTLWFSPLEFRLLFALRDGLPTSYQYLIEALYACSDGEPERVNLGKMVDRTRKKLLGTGIYIYCVQKYGYILYPEEGYR